MVTAFLPILGWKFEWLDIHWVTGLVLTVVGAVPHHPRPVLAESHGHGAGRQGHRQPPMAARPGKYNLAQKLYHLAIAVLILCAIASGLLMLRKIDTPFWKRDPYWFTDHGWGVVYAIHDFAAMALVTMVMIHVYFALRPDEWHLTRSMFRGWMTRKEYQDHYRSQALEGLGRLNPVRCRRFAASSTGLSPGPPLKRSIDVVSRYCAHGSGRGH